ncbi:uncharacterized protein [Palaemon carinicauda]|uniref:uncharacterized protein n=1 Tax=Palaemon carinicauda TaxID=392227 RepID=UPI0035B668AB
MKTRAILVLATVLVLLLYWTGPGICIVGQWRYKWQSVGACGGPFLVLDIPSSIQCAAVCSSDTRCQGYTLRSRTVPNAACELTENISMNAMDSVGNCFVKDELQTTATTTTITTTTTTTTTTTPTTTIIGEMASNVTIDGATGIRAIGFSTDSYTYLDVLLPISLGPTNASVLDGLGIVKSTVVVNYGEGNETCPGFDQVFVGYGKINTTDREKDDQRLYCSTLVSPYGLTSNCTTVRLGGDGTGIPPKFENVDTSSWLNWLLCPEGAMMTGIYWNYLKGDKMTNYGYNSATCCLADTQL